jgi:hypothetical protein
VTFCALELIASLALEITIFAMNLSAWARDGQMIPRGMTADSLAILHEPHAGHPQQLRLPGARRSSAMLSNRTMMLYLNMSPARCLYQ